MDVHQFYRKVFFTFLFTALLISCEETPQETPVEIPDKAFLQVLIDLGTDTNKDGQISQEEAEVVSTLTVPPSGITDLTGLEAFTRLDSLTITLNPLEGIDLSGNGALRYLECTYCELSTLDLSNNLELEELICNRNQLRELAISLNRSLVKLTCKNNLLSSLDLSANVGLTKMVSCGNMLNRLDISMLPNLTILGVDNMPMLTEVCVRALPFPPEGVTVIMGFSPNINFITTCNW
jgi:hypothetical protein